MGFKKIHARRASPVSASGRVQATPPTHRYLDVQRADTDVGFEANHSKSLLEANLGCKVLTFVYPFGSVDAHSHGVIMRPYTFGLHVGSALNAGWFPRRQPLCRVGGDDTPDLCGLLSWHRRTAYGLKWMVNGLRAAVGKWQPR